MNKNVVVKKHETFIENNRLYLKLVYEYEDDHGVYELIIPKIDLDICTDFLPAIKNYEPWTGPMVIDYYKIRLGSNIFDLLRGDVEIKKNGETLTCEKAAYIVNILKEKPKEMTLAEIEKKLGYKVKLVSEDIKNE